MATFPWKTSLRNTTANPFLGNSGLDAEIKAQLAVWVAEGKTDGQRAGDLDPTWTVGNPGMQYSVVRAWTTEQTAQEYVTWMQNFLQSKGLPVFDQVLVVQEPISPTWIPWNETYPVEPRPV